MVHKRQQQKKAETGIIIYVRSIIVAAGFRSDCLAMRLAKESIYLLQFRNRRRRRLCGGTHSDSIAYDMTCPRFYVLCVASSLIFAK